jgi:hypothetical protein
MCTLVFYFANRNRSKIKFELNSNEFVNYKVLQILESFLFYSLYSLGPNLCLFSKPAQSASFPILLGSLIPWPSAAQWLARARAGLVFPVKTWPSRIFPSPTENPLNPNRNLVQTSTGDSVGAVFLLRAIGKQNPYK